jgi:hypothetical protein
MFVRNWRCSVRGMLGFAWRMCSQTWSYGVNLAADCDAFRLRCTYPNSAAVGMRPWGVYLSTASGRFFDRRDRISSRDSPVC